MKVYIIRHGLTELNKKKKVNGEIDEPLAPEGIEQAKNAITVLPKTIKHIYSSPMLRAKQTAKIIISKLKVPVSEVAGLTEIRMGSLAGKSWEEMEDGLDLKQKHRTVKFDYTQYGGESVKEVTNRLITFLRRINGKHQDFEALIITHGGIIRVIHLLEHGKPLVNEIEHISLITFDLSRILK